MDVAEFIANHPRLFHMTAPDAWPTILRHGLRSVTAILDLLYVDKASRRCLESDHRPKSVTLSDIGLGTFVIRDQGPLNSAKLADCLDDEMTPEEWRELLNRKVFFWPTEDRFLGLLTAYSAEPHLVLTIKTSSLVAIWGPEITLSPINTGSVLFKPARRGRSTMAPIVDYPFDVIRKRKGSAKGAIAEVAVDYAVPDIVNHIVRVELRQHGRRAQLLGG
jgi:hypothetical protein